MVSECKTNCDWSRVMSSGWILLRIRSKVDQTSQGLYEILGLFLRKKSEKEDDKICICTPFSLIAVKEKQIYIRLN